jgi:hypothetical protein
VLESVLCFDECSLGLDPLSLQFSDCLFDSGEFVVTHDRDEGVVGKLCFEG